MNRVGIVAAACGDEVVLWSPQTRQLVARVRLSATAASLAFSDDGRRLAVLTESATLAVYVIAESGGLPLSAQSLRLTSQERQALADVAPLIATPRSAKRLVNTYRLLRAGLDAPEQHLLETEDLQVVVLLLAMLIGFPEQTAVVLDQLVNGSEHELLSALLRDAPPNLQRAVERIQDTTNTTDDVVAYRRWTPRVARFSFRTCHLLPGPAKL